MNRRDFLKGTALATAAVACSPLRVDAGTERPVVRSYREIGSTGLRMSDISFGCGKLPSASMILRAVERGINYFDTSPDYGPSERHIGEAMKGIRRERIILASKLCRPIRRGHIRYGSSRKDYIAAVEGSLSRLKTEYLDICFVHAIGSLSKNRGDEEKRLLDEEMLSAVDSLKRAGKVRFLGVSSHGPNHMEDLLMTAVRSGHFDLIMPAFNFMKFPRVPEVMKEAKKRGIGVVAMKTLAGAKEMNLEAGDEPFETAALKWVLKHPEVSGLVVTIKTVSDLDLYLRASGKGFTAADQEVLDRYARIYGRQYCRTGCNDCEADCPKGVEVATVLRYRMYFKDYGMEKRAMESYADLGRGAEDCLTCRSPSCAGACPYGLPVRELLRDAHETLSFRV